MSKQVYGPGAKVAAIAAEFKADGYPHVHASTTDASTAGESITLSSHREFDDYATYVVVWERDGVVCSEEY